MHKCVTALGLVALSAGVIASTPAQAKIYCKGEYQVIRGAGLQSTPYCEMKNLYKVARGSYGISTTFARLRNYVSEREEVCRAIGHDHRVYGACTPYRIDSGSRRYTR